MTRETKIGMLMVLLMAGVFGFLVYKRTMQTTDSVAQSGTEGEDTTENDNPTSPGDSLLPPAGEEPREILPVAAQTRHIPDDESEDLEDPFGGRESTPVASRSNQPRLPTMIPDDEEPAAEESDDFLTNTNVRTEPDSSESAADDPFSGSESVTTNATPAPVRSSPRVQDFAATEPEIEEENGFAVESAGPMRTVPLKSAPTRVVESLDEQETVTVRARAAIPEPAVEFDDAAVEEEPAFPDTFPTGGRQPANPSFVDDAAEESSSAPALMLDDSDEDRYGGYQPEELTDAPKRVPATAEALGSSPTNRKASVLISGDSYQIQNGDNFWSISQKKYGTGRYFQALAAHNQRQIPDPNKMKLGTEIQLPQAAELERKYPTLIQASGTTDPTATGGTPAEATGELLTGPDGQPRYRVGPGDTLSGIAQKYLGRSRRWEQILEMNRDVLKDGNSLKLGAVLRLPSDAAQLQISNQPRFNR